MNKYTVIVNVANGKTGTDGKKLFRQVEVKDVPIVQTMDDVLSLLSDPHYSEEIEWSLNKQADGTTPKAKGPRLVRLLANGIDLAARASAKTSEAVDPVKLLNDVLNTPGFANHEQKAEAMKAFAGGMVSLRKWRDTWVAAYSQE